MKDQQKQKKKQEKITLDSLYALMHENEEKSKREWQRMREEAQKRSDEIDRKIAENARLIGDIGNSNGDVAEEYFQNAFEKDPRLNGEFYDKVITNMKIKSEKFNAEYDIFLLNDKSAAIIEIKYRAKKDDINELLRKCDDFRKFMPEYSNLKLYLGLASLSFRKITEQNILKEGIAVIKQVGDKMVIYDKNLKAF